MARFKTGVSFGAPVLLRLQTGADCIPLQSPGTVGDLSDCRFGRQLLLLEQIVSSLPSLATAAVDLFRVERMLWGHDYTDQP